MGRPKDDLRILRALSESDGLTNARLRTELDLTDKRYRDLKNELLKNELISLYRTRGGGLKITSEGEKRLKEQTPESTEDIASSVPNEKALYQPMIDLLRREIKEEEVLSIPIDTSNLRTKGKWQNPDIVQITVQSYKYLRKTETVVKTYEVKQWRKWDIGVVFEAASHRRFSHESIVVLEWPRDVTFSLTDTTYKVDEIARECNRFKVGLMTLRPYHRKSYRLHQHLDAESHTPEEASVETWLEYIFEKKEDKYKKEYIDMLNEADNFLRLEGIN